MRSYAYSDFAMILSNHGFVLGHLEIVSVSETVIVLKSLWTSGRCPGDNPGGDVFSILLALVCDLCLLFFSVGGLLAFINTPLPSLLRTAPTSLFSPPSSHCRYIYLSTASFQLQSHLTWPSSSTHPRNHPEFYLLLSL